LRRLRKLPTDWCSQLFAKAQLNCMGIVIYIILYLRIEKAGEE